MNLQVGFENCRYEQRFGSVHHVMGGGYPKPNMDLLVKGDVDMSIFNRLALGINYTNGFLNTTCTPNITPSYTL